MPFRGQIVAILGFLTLPGPGHHRDHKKYFLQRKNVFLTVIDLSAVLRSGCLRAYERIKMNTKTLYFTYCGDAPLHQIVMSLARPEMLWT